MATEPRRVPPLHTIYFYVTGSCNLRCRHCWIDPVTESHRSTLHLPWRELKPIFEEAKAIGLRSVKLTGGEPFLHPDILQILADLPAMGLGVRMETNGTLIGEREATALKEAKANFSISLDGPTAEVHDDLRNVPGAFNKTMKGISAVRAQGLGFQIICSLYRKNADLLPSIAGFAETLGAHSLKVNVIASMGRSDEMREQGELLSLPEVLDVRSRMPVPTNGFQLYFDLPPALLPLRDIVHNGITTCGIMGILGVLHNGHAGLCGIGEHVPEMDFGDLRHVSIKEVWENHPTLTTLREKVPAGLEGICGRCIFRNVCLGKCVANTFHATGIVHGAFNTCTQAEESGLFPEKYLVEHRSSTCKDRHPRARIGGGGVMSKLKLNPDLVFREDNDGGLIFDPATGTVQVLNDTAAFICKLLDGSREAEEIVAAVVAEFEVEDPAAAQVDASHFIEELRSRSMIQNA
ncbi:MAG: PqqD family peptide modification chaperone [Planctomycetes bacterium]|jgi:SynChlorMet cassette radical SAM/SPASM protein ScmF|nr:PqqD family peptide modification chaperone [Planctomycetota bacterium]